LNGSRIRLIDDTAEFGAQVPYFCGKMGCRVSILNSIGVAMPGSGPKITAAELPMHCYAPTVTFAFNV
jgi:hypothetical protein